MSLESEPIVAGKGIGPCCVGASKQTAVDLFGHPGADPIGWNWRRLCTVLWSTIHKLISQNKGVANDSNAGGTPIPNYLQFPALGVDVSYDSNNQITCLFFYFRAKTHQSFKGCTSLGIGFDSSVDDVLKQYGTPTGMAEHSYNGQKDIRYDANGISFTFTQNVLEDIRVYKPRATWWPAEWPHRPYSHAIDWLAFKPAGLTVPVMDAQASFLEFARVVEQDRLQLSSQYQAVLIQAFIEAIPGKPIVGEFAYLSDVSTDGKEITGSLIASPFCRADLTEGTLVTFNIEYLSDWFLVPANQLTGLGGFTVPYALAQLSEREQEEEMRASPFCWYSQRKNISAENELFAIPPCNRCNKRYLGIELSATPGVCPICIAGGQRCACPSCGSPLIRFPGQPAACGKCATSAG